jgi:hypothetical protein
MCIAAAQDIQGLVAENDRLVFEVNALRAQLGVTTLTSSEPMLVTQATMDLMAVKNEVYGEFPAGFGDNWAHNPQEPQYSTGDPILEEDEAMRPLPLDLLSTSDPSYHEQLSAHDELNPVYYQPPGIIQTLEPSDLDQWDLNNQLVPHLTSLIDQFTSTQGSLEKCVSMDTPSHHTEMLTTSLNPSTHSWPQNIEMGHKKFNSNITSNTWSD